MMLALIQGSWLERVRLVRTFLALAGWLEAVLGVAYFVAYAGWTLDALRIPELAASARPGALVSLLGGATHLFDWIFPFVCWAVLTLLLQMYDLFREEEVAEMEATSEINQETEGEP
jgi:hypothetical protein